MSRNKYKIRALSVVLSVVVMAGGIPITSLAANEEEILQATEVVDENKQKITAFETLPDEITKQSVPVGTELEELNLPDTVTVTLQNSTDLKGQDIPVTWKSDMTYEKEKAGVYSFTPVIEDYTVEADIPIITITVAGEFVPEIESITSNNVEANQVTASGTEWEITEASAETILTISSDAGMDDWIANGKNNYGTNITKVVIADGVESISTQAFANCKNLTSVDIPSSIRSIENGAFWCCEALSSITIPDGVTTIESQVFLGCSSISSIEIPKSVSSLGIEVFSGCSNLEQINVDSNNQLFHSEDGILYETNSKTLICYPTKKTGTEFSIPNGVKIIASGAFYMCSSLSSIEIPNSVITIEGLAFYKCSSLNSIDIPDSITNIGNGVFDECSNLKQINVGSNNLVFHSEDGILYNTNSQALLCYPAGKTGTDFSIPNGIKSINESAFQSCKNLFRIKIPNSVNYIGNYAFSLCTNLNDIEIPNSVSDIGYSAFSNCVSLSSIEIPNSVKKIKSNTFMYCYKLKEITFLMDTPPSFENYIFSDVLLTAIYVPRNTVSEYKKVSALASYTNTIQEIPDSKYFTVSTNGGSGDGEYYRSAPVTIKADENTDEQKFDSWSSNDGIEFVDANSATTTFNMPASNVTVTANYVKAYKVTVKNGSTVDDSYKEGDTVTITADEATEGYTFDCWTSVDGVIFADANSETTTFNMPASNVAVTATYKSNTVAVAGLTLSKSSTYLKAGDSLTLNGTISPTNATDVGITWSSSDNNIATVDSNGLVTAKNVGIVVITATSNSNTSISATCTVNITANTVAATGIALNQTNASLEAGNTIGLTATMTPSNTTDQSITWSSSDNSIATVDVNGLVTVKGIGNAVITATSNSNPALMATCTITVSIGQVTGLTAQKNNTTSISLAWEKQNNVTGYQIYRYDSKKKKYIIIATKKKDSTTTYNDKKLSVANTYRYKVRAFVTEGKKTIYGDYSNVLKTATVSKKPTLTSSAGSKKVKLTWDKLSGVSGYEIYMSTEKNTGFSLVNKVSSKKTTYTIKNLVKGKTYYFKIRTYTTVAGVNIYSDYSKVKKVKVK